MGFLQAAFHRHGRLAVVAFFVGAAALVFSACYWFYERNREDTDDAFIDTHIIEISPKVEG